MKDKDLEQFKKQVKRELKGLNKEQIVQFAWLCAMRALPILRAKDNFNYWNNEDIKKHLYNIFSAIDVSGAVGFYNSRFSAFATDISFNAISRILLEYVRLLKRGDISGRVKKGSAVSAVFRVLIAIEPAFVYHRLVSFGNVTNPLCYQP